MSMGTALRQIERSSEYFADRGGVITDNRQAVATFGTDQRERPNNYVATRTHGAQNSFGVGSAILRISQKMERGAVVPHVVGLPSLLPGAKLIFQCCGQPVNRARRRKTRRG